MTGSRSRYKTLRLKEEEYEKIKELQRYLVRKGTDSIDMQELRRQSIVDVPEDEEGASSEALTMGFVLGLGAAALAYLLWKGSKK